MKHLTAIAAAAAIAAGSFGATPAVAVTTIDFESTVPGGQTNPLTILDATFTSPGDGLFVANFGFGDNTLAICSYTGTLCDQSLDLSFSSAGGVSDFSFLYAGVDNSESTLTVLLNFFGGSSTTLFYTSLVGGSTLDFSAYSNILSASITSNDPYGLSYDNFTYTIDAAVPEPATWAMMILGFGFVGAALRRQRRNRHLTIA